MSTSSLDPKSSPSTWKRRPSQYRRGVRLEYAAKRLLEGLGYLVVRSAGSHGPVDLVAIGLNDVLAIQIKSKGGCDQDAIVALSKVPPNPGVTIQVWEYRDGDWEIVWSA